VPELERTLWRLESYLSDSGEPVPVPEAVVATARFEAGRVFGSGGCNRYGGSYRLSGDRIVVEQVVATLMACPGPAGEVEQGFLPQLHRASSYAVDDSRLDLFDAEGRVVLAFVAAPEPGLTGPVWVVTGLNNGASAVTGLVPGPEVTLEFAGAGTVSGFAGCNRFSGPFVAVGDAVRFGPLATTRRACEPQVMEQERQLLAAIARVTRYVIEGNRLDLRDDDGSMQVSLRARE
jgi:heat shock protein HslJ